MKQANNCLVYISRIYVMELTVVIKVNNFCMFFQVFSLLECFPTDITDKLIFRFRMTYRFYNRFLLVPGSNSNTNYFVCGARHTTVTLLVDVLYCTGTSGTDSSKPPKRDSDLELIKILKN